jgi:hypothetical protein
VAVSARKQSSPKRGVNPLIVFIKAIYVCFLTGYKDIHCSTLFLNACLVCHIK